MGRCPGVQELYYFFPYKNSEVFDRFLEGLIKAGFKGDPSKYYKIENDEKLGHKEIKELLTGKILSGFIWGYSWSRSVSKEGITIYSMSKDGTVLIKTNGKTWFEGDSICYQHKNLYGGLKFCADVYSNPEGNLDDKSEYFMFTDFSILPFSINQNDF